MARTDPSPLRTRWEARWAALRERWEPRVRTVLESGDRTRDAALARVQAVADRSPRPVRAGLDLTVRTVRDSIEDRVPGLAAEVALFTLISLPALVLVVLGSLGYVAAALGPAGREEFDRLVYTVPHAALSPDTYDAYSSLVDSVIDSGRVDVIGFGLLLGLWTGSRAMNRVLETLTIAYDLPSGRVRWKQRLLALVLTAGALLGAVALLPALVVGPQVVQALLPTVVADAAMGAFDWTYWPVMAALAVAALATLYHVGVPWSTPWLRDLPGAALAMVIWMAAAAALRAYLALRGPTIEGGDAVYAQLGTPIAVVLWLWASAIAVLLGAELNAEIEKKWPTIDRPEPDDDPRAPTQGQLDPRPGG